MYHNLLQDNKVWIKRAAKLALFVFVSGFVVFLAKPELLPKFIEILGEIFKEILGTDELVISWQSAAAIWRQNLTVGLIAIFLGIIAGLAPIVIVGFNFAVLGFISGAALFYGGDGGPNFWIFLITILPHGIVEIPALILSAALGLRFGFSLINREFKKVFVQILQFLPLLAAMFLLAALIEIFITGNLVKLLLE
ncbi:MAG: stage II sporulation protein M [bacterium]|nr:stage II sporulation protein M [bacterium]